MPMLTMLRIGFPVCPVPGPASDAAAEVGHAIEDGVHGGDDVLAVHHHRRPFRRAQRDVEDGAVLGDVDPVAAEHGFDPGAQPDLFGQTDEQCQGLVGNPVLRVVEINAGGLGVQPIAASGVAREQLAQMHAADALAMRFQSLPCGSINQASGCLQPVHGHTTSYPAAPPAGHP